MIDSVEEGDEVRFGEIGFSNSSVNQSREGSLFCSGSIVQLRFVSWSRDAEKIDHVEKIRIVGHVIVMALAFKKR